jgi:VWFA-related protein
VLNVLVHDRTGHPVGDLSKSDFEVTDAGRRQTVSVFTVNRLALEPSGTSLPKTLPRNIATNRPLTQVAEPASVTVVVIDQYNTELIDQVHVKREVIKFLRTLESNHLVALYTLNSKGFGIVHDFTDNAASLQAGMAKTAPHLSRDQQAANVDAANTGDEHIDQMMDESNTLMSEFFSRNRILNTCAAFKSLADHLSGIPGRKNLVWITGGVPEELLRRLMKSFPGSDGNTMEGQSQSPGRGGQNKQEVNATRDGAEQSFASYIDEVGQALNNANVAIYPVDARGVQTPPFTKASKNFKMDGVTHGLPDSAFRVGDQNTTTMEYLARMTGGKAFYNTNGIAEAVRSAIDDSSVSYTLGYYVSASEWDNRYHKLKVTVSRSGINVRTKQGYLAQDRPTPTSAQIEDTLKKAVWSPLDSTRLSVAARVDPSSTLPNASRFSFAIVPSEMNLRQENGRYMGELDLLVIQHRKGGEHATEPQKTITLALTPERYQLMLQNGMVLTKDLTMHADTVAVRIIVLDRASGATGSVTMTIDPEDKSGTNEIAPAGQTTPDKRRDWQTGNVASVRVASIEPLALVVSPQLVGPVHPGQPPPDASDHASGDTPHDQAFTDPQANQRSVYATATIVITIVSDRGTYVAKRITALFSEPHSAREMDPAWVAPWVKELPARIEFSVKDRTLYYLDTKGKERKATLLHP